MPKPAKAVELEERPSFRPRGAELKAQIEARALTTERAHALHLEARASKAGKENTKVEKAAQRREERLRVKREKVAEKEEKHSQRQAEQVEARRSKAQATNLAVLTVVRQHSDQGVAAAAEAARDLDEKLAAAGERHAFELARVRAKGSAEAQKVEARTAAARAEAELKASALAEATEAQAQAAAQRRAASLSQIAAKGAAEVAKVEALGVRPYDRPQAGEGGAASGSLLDEESPSPPPHSTLNARRRRLAPLSPPSPPPQPVFACEGSVSRGAEMMLTLMRGGAPNNEVLLATSVDDYRAIARKYKISLEAGGGAASGGGIGGPAQFGGAHVLTAF